MTLLNHRLTGFPSILAAICLWSGRIIYGIIHNAFGHWGMYFGYLLVVFALTDLDGIQEHQAGILDWPATYCPQYGP
jgi:hypothetical protein